MVAWSGESLEVQNQVCKVFKFGLLVSDSVRMEHVIDGWRRRTWRSQLEIGSGDTTACILIFPNLIVDADIGSDSELGKVFCASFSRERV